MKSSITLTFDLAKDDKTSGFCLSLMKSFGNCNYNKMIVLCLKLQVPHRCLRVHYRGQTQAKPQHLASGHPRYSTLIIFLHWVVSLINYFSLFYRGKYRAYLCVCQLVCVSACLSVSVMSRMAKLLDRFWWNFQKTVSSWSRKEH